MSSSLSRFSGWRSRSLSLGEGLTDSTGARDGTRADAVLDRGRRRLFSFLAFRLAAPSSYPYVVLSLRHFRLASWRSLSLGGWWPRIRCGAVTAARCLLDLLGPAQRVLAADGAVAGGANSVLVIFRFGATLELGRSERTTMRPLWRYGVDAANTPDRKPR